MQQKPAHSILVAGSIAYDHFYDYEGSFLDGIDTSKLADLSVSFSVSRHRKHTGGAGANVAWNMALLGESPLLLATAGSDATPYIERMKQEGVRTDAITVNPAGITAHAIIVTDDAKRQITFFDPGVEMDTKWEDRLSPLGEIDLAILTPWKPHFMLPVIAWCEKHAVPFIFDPGQHILDFNQAELTDILGHCRGLVLNEYEWHLLQTRSGKSAEEIRNSVPFAVITRGENGFEIFEGEHISRFPACTHDNTVNPTGAGDAFRAGLLTGILEGWPLALGCQLGAAIASLVVEIEATQLPALDLEEVRLRAKRAYEVELLI